MAEPRKIDGSYRICVRRGDIEFDISSPDPSWLDSKMQELSALVFESRNPAPVPETGSSKPRRAAPKPVSLAEHVRKVGPSGGLEHVLAVGYYLERHSRLKGGFRRRDLAEAFGAIRYRHSNPGVPIAAARRQGLLMDGEEHEKMLLTETGERWVEDRLAN